MAKKSKDDAPTANGVANRDIIQRLNFLYQASVFLNTVPSSQVSTSSSSANSLPGPSETKQAGKKRKRSSKDATTARDLSRIYIATMKNVGQKTLVKIIPAPPILTDSILPNNDPQSTLPTEVAPQLADTTTAIYVGENSMDVDSARETTDKYRNEKARRKGVQPRIPPLFARDGHVVFRGSERLVESDLGDGVYIT
ncbi:hypothetical protein DXG01_006874 [Tephrocybe rancida]|nr:hypothetical protein DXG01_006874 [Tephrocybe rancida]